MRKLNARQLDVLAAAARGEVYRLDSPPYSAYRDGDRRAISRTTDGLQHRALLRVGERRQRYTLFLVPTETGYAELAARGCTEANGWTLPEKKG